MMPRILGAAAAILLTFEITFALAAQPKPLEVGTAIPLSDTVTATLLYSGTTVPPLPIPFQLPSNTNGQVILVTESFYTSKSSLGKLSVLLDSYAIGEIVMFDSQAIHVAFPPGYFISGLRAGAHTLAFTPLGATQSDEDDSFKVILFDYH